MFEWWALIWHAKDMCVLGLMGVVGVIDVVGVIRIMSLVDVINEIIRECHARYT